MNGPGRHGSSSRALRVPVRQRRLDPHLWCKAAVGLGFPRLALCPVLGIANGRLTPVTILRRLSESSQTVFGDSRYGAAMFTLLVGLLWTAGPLGFQQALELAEASPVLEAAERVPARRRAEGDGMSSLTANPIFQVQPGGRRMKTGGRGGEIYLGVSQRLNLGSFGKKRKVSVSREVEHDAALVSVMRQRVRVSVAEAWLSRWSAQQSMAIAEAEERLAAELEERLSQALAAGEATRIDLAVATAWRAEAALTALAAEGDAFVSGVELSRALGVAPETPLIVDAELPSIDLPEQQAMQATLGHVERAPHVIAAEAERAAEHARYDEVAAARAPQLSVGALGWREGAGDLAAVATLELEMPVFERAQRERATQAAAIARGDGAALEAALSARTERVLALHEVEHSQQVLDATEQKVVVAAESLAEAQRLRLEAREATAQEWVVSRRAVLRAKLDVLHARSANCYARFLARELWSVQTNPDGRPRSAPSAHETQP